MKKIDPTPEFIKKNYDKTIAIINEMIKSDRKQKILDLFNFFDERYATCPASNQKIYYSAFPGGLAYHNLSVLQCLGRLASMMAKDEFNNESLIVISFLHNIGLLGNKDKEYFLVQTSDWHKQQGIMYSINPKIDFVKVPHRSLFLLQEFDILLSKDEYMTILLQDGREDDSNKNYCYKDSKLAQIFQFAKSWTIKMERAELEY